MLLLLSSNSRPTSSAKSSPTFWIAQVVGAMLLCPPDLIERRLPMVAPVPSTLQELQTRIEVDKILETCWKNPDAGYQVQPTDEWIVNNQQQQQQEQQQSGTPFAILEEETFLEDATETTVVDRKKPSTYGEITSLGARQLFGSMGLMDSTVPRNNKIHFFDLGSGTGKLVGQAFLELPCVEKATGIELSPSRHESAIVAKKALLGLAQQRGTTTRTITTARVSLDGNDNDNDNYSARNRHTDASSLLSREILLRCSNDQLELLQGDLFDADLSAATHIYVASLCFPHNLMVRLEERLQDLLQQQQQQAQREDPDDDSTENESSNHGSSTLLQWVATLQPFPNNLGGIRPVVRFMEMSWTKPLGCAVYLYQCSSNL